MVIAFDAETPLKRALVYRLFSEAMERPDVERAEFLDERCQGDAQLRGDLEALIGIAQADPVETGILNGDAPVREESLSGRTVGRFRLLELIGQGGMGVVYRAERTDGVQQLVAVKLVPRVIGPAAEQRFVRESQILARLEHSSIARLIDAGVEDSRAWMAIEFVRGERIDTYCENRQLSTVEVVRLLVPLAAAVAAAHALLVVHSDIKPANVLVTAEGQPKLIDFGIATALRDADLGKAPTVNLAGLFSANYAATEQVSGGVITVATDVFGLGALAYRLLTGEAIHRDATTPVAYLLAVTERDVRPASRTATAAACPKLARMLRGDLDAILGKALERDPARRYPSAADFQADLQRYLDGRPVLARAPSLGYRLSKFARRNALAVGLSALLLASLTVGGAMAWLQSRSAALARDMAARRGEFLEALLKSADPRAGRRDVSVAELLDAAAATLHQRLGDEPLVEASMLGLIANTNDGLGRYPQGLAASQRQIELLETHGGSALDVARALSSQAELLRELGQWEQAEPVVRRAIQTFTALHATADLAQALDLLGIVLSRTHRESEAEAIYRREIELESRGDETLQNRRLYPYQALTALFVDLGRYADADAYGQKALGLAQRTLAADHPDRLAIEAQYASVLVNRRQAARAEPIFREVIARASRSSGGAHKDTLMFQWLLADALIDLHRDAEAAALARATAPQLDALLGEDNHYSLSSWETYAVASCNAGEVDAGLAAIRRVQAVRSRTLARGDRLRALADLGAGECLYRAGRYPEAETVLLSAAAELEAARGPSYRRTQEAYRALQNLYTATGRDADGQRWAAKVEQ